MQKTDSYNFLNFYKLLIVVAVFNLFVIQAFAQLPYAESFKNATAADLVLSGVPGDAILTSGTVDPAGQGYLRLTNNQNNQSGYVRSTRSFPSLNGLSISFDYFTYGGTGADGISFFLYDSSVGAFNIGAFGGSLGYAQSVGSPGVSKGFIALGLDEFGNFSNPNAGRQGGPGRRLSSVLLRGDGNGLGTGTPGGSNYEYLTGISTNNTTEMAAAGAGGSFQIAGGVDGRTIPTGLSPLHAGYRRAKIDMIPNATHTGFILNVWITEGNVAGAIIHHVIKDYNYIPTDPIPLNLSYGFSAGTGSASNFHEIRNLEILKPIDPLTVPIVSNVTAVGIQNVDLVFKSSDFTSNFSHPSSRPLTKIKVQNLPLYGILKLNGTNVIAGQEIILADISKLRFVPDTDFAGSASFQWNGSDGDTYAVSDAFVNIRINALNPTFPYLESFKNATAAGLVIASNPGSAELTSGRGDATGAGYLRLTNNQAGQTGYVYNTRDFPSEKGISVSFDYYGHGGSGSDGINFFLYDAAANPFSIGASGGAMGYTHSYTSNGLSKGFIGLSIDEYGNFSSPGSGRGTGPGRSSGSVTLRGDGDGNTLIPSNYEYLTHIQTNNPTEMSAVGAGNPFQLSGNTNGRDAGATGLDSLNVGFRRIKMDLVPNGSGTGYVVNVWIAEGNPAGAIIHHLIKDYQYIPGELIPANFRFGFWASSGGGATSYEIRNLEILLPSNLDHKPVLNKISKSVNEDQVLSFKLSDFTNSFFDPKGLNTLQNIEFTSLPPANEGVLKLDGTAVNSSQLIPVSDISAGKLSFIPVPDFFGSVSSFKWNGHTTTNKALVDEEVIITVNSVNDAPAGTDKEVVIKVNDNGYIFAEADFGFSDLADNNSNTFLGVKIVDLPGSGALKLNNMALSAGQFIALDAIQGGQLKFIPGLNETGKPYTSFTFQVKDNGGLGNGGLDTDQTANVFKFNVSPLPSIQLTQANPVICIGTVSAEIKYNAVAGDPVPNLYSINWDNSANNAGLNDVSDKDLTGTITIDGLSGLAAGIYRASLTVRSSTNSSVSNEMPISLTVRPLLRAVISYGSDSFCAKGKASVLFTGDLGGKFSSAPGLNINESSGEINLSESIPGNYTVSYSLSNDVCSVTANTSLSINAVPVISAITGASTISAGSTSQLSSNTTGGTWSSTNSAIASINSTGLVSGLKMGSTQIVYRVKAGNCVDSVSFQINVREPSKLIFDQVPDIEIPSNSKYLIQIPKLNGSAIGKIKYTLIGKDSILFKLDAVMGIVSMEGKNFDFASDSDRDNVYEIGLKATDSDQNTAFVFWKVKIVRIQELETFSMLPFENVIIDEKMNYTGPAPVLIGKAVGKVLYSLSGKDSNLFTINELNGIVSMRGRDFDFPIDHDKNNVYEVGVVAKDAIGTKALSEWKVIIRMVPPSAVQSMLTPEIMSMPISADALQLLTIITKYPNGDRYLKGGEQVLISRVSGAATIGQVTDLENGTYTVQVYPGPKAGRSVFVATLGGKEIMNGTGVVAKAIVEFGVSNDTRLKTLVLSSGNLLPQFKTEVSDYSAYFEYSVDSIGVIPALNDPNAIVEINGFKLSKTGSRNIPLLVGNNPISVIVTAADGLSKQRYKININRAEAVFPYKESFMNNIAEGLVIGVNPNQSKLTSGTLDVSGMGYLRLTGNKTKESGFVYNSKKIPTEKGLSISFEYFSHGEGIGDGLSFFLFDARTNFKIGAFNGSLGYAQNVAQAGLNKGFLGLALDEYGEFSSSGSNKQGGPGRRPGSIVLRGDGNGESIFKDNYEYLTGIQTTDATAMKLAGAGSKFQIFGNQDGRTAPGGALDQDEAAYRKLKIQLLPNNDHTGFIINVWITEGANGTGIVHHVIKDYHYKPTDGIPVDLKYGFAASSGISAKSYEIRNLEITIPEASQTIPVKPDVSPEDASIKLQATNLISLNGDGINDLWIVRNIEDFGNNSVKIFNRVGQEVYRKVNYANDWDGKKGGNPLPSGTYYYVFEHSKSKIPVKGYITILQSN